jgi:UDP-N-acetylmuramyl pentapeptide phosphotransferase/UDP-N-acetylglucosamine-1-phosphate transferase
MLTKYFIIIFIQLLISYFAFKYYYKSSFIVITHDEFTSFQRGKVVNGTGIIFLIIFLIFFYIYLYIFDLNFYVPEKFYIFLLVLSILGLVSFLDDYKNLDAILRLITQILGVYFALATVPHIINFLPIKLSIIISLLFWVYIMNINNFIDGADGFCATVSISFFLLVLFVTFYLDLNLFSKFIAILILPILFAFKLFNFPPAKAFMGDAGSIFLGFLIGYCIIELSFNGFPLFAVAAYSYPIVDCSVTLFKKMARGYLPWKRLGDYYFLMPKKNILNKNFIIVEKKIYFFIFFFSIINSFFLIFSIILKMQYLALVSFLLAILLVLLYRNSKNF